MTTPAQTPPRPPLNYTACALDEVVDDAVHWVDNEWRPCGATSNYCQAPFRAKRIIPPEGYRLMGAQEVPNKTCRYYCSDIRVWTVSWFCTQGDTVAEMFNAYEFQAVACPLEKEKQERSLNNQAEFEAEYGSLLKENESLKKQLASAGWQEISATNRPNMHSLVILYSVESLTVGQSADYRYITNSGWTHFIYPPSSKPIEKSVRQKWYEDYMASHESSSLQEIFEAFAQAAKQNQELLQ